MLIEHLNLLPCPVCQEEYTWSIDGITHEDRIIDGKVTCGKGHSWHVSQEILRFDKENSNEEAIYSDRERTGYPNHVQESERANFLDFLDEYFQSLKFENTDIVISGDPILYYRFLKDKKNRYIASHKEEKILRQLHEMAVRRRVHNQHSFVRHNKLLESETTNQLIIFPDQKYKSPLHDSLVLQFIDKTEKPNGSVVWVGEKYKLEELSSLS